VFDPDRSRTLALVAVGLVVTAAAVGIAVGAGAVDGQALLIEDVETGEESLSVPVEENSTVTIAYTHSVEKTPVRDVYAVRDAGLVMTRMEFQSFGAGLPSTVDVERSDGGSFVYHPPDRRTEALLVATSPVAGHELVVDGERYDLVELADGGSVRLRVTTRLRIRNDTGQY